MQITTLNDAQLNAVLQANAYLSNAGLPLYHPLLVSALQGTDKALSNRAISDIDRARLDAATNALTLIAMNVG